MRVLYGASICAQRIPLGRRRASYWQLTWGDEERTEPPGEALGASVKPSPTPPLTPIPRAWSAVSPQSEVCGFFSSGSAPWGRSPEPGRSLPAQPLPDAVARET